MEPNTQPAENSPGVWRHELPWPDSSSYKYRRGHVLVLGGETMTGAARLSAYGAARVGAGLVTIAAPRSAWPVYSSALTSIMVQPFQGRQDWQAILADNRKNVIVAGPGAGISPITRTAVLDALATGRPVVLDADGLSVFASRPEMLFSAIRGVCILTPHEGEFARLFQIEGSKSQRARRAARQSGAIIILKGATTIVAAPDGRLVVNNYAPAELATAGSGDVLTGIVAGLVAQGMNPFLSAAAAVWMHGEAARRFGPGLMAEDLPDMLPRVLRDLKGEP